MKIFVKLCGSIIRRNKGFTAGFLIMSVLSTAIAFLGANFGPSSDATIMTFLEESGMPDAVFLTDSMPGETAGIIQSIPGVRLVSARFVFDTNLETEDGRLFSVRVFSRDENAPFTHTCHEEIATETAEPGAAVSSEFAAHNGIHAGDPLLLKTPLADIKLIADRIVSNPETMSCTKDEMSSYESYQFGYLYLRNSDLEEIIPAGGNANQWMVYFEPGLDRVRREECMEQIRAALGSHLISESLTEESEALSSIRDDLHTISILCSFIPGIIWMISLGFSYLFIRIIIENHRKMIGLLRALGFPIRKIVLIFITYTVLVNVPALLLGIFIGSGLLRLCLGLVAESEGILKMCVVVSPGITTGMLLTVFVIGIAAALLSAKAIARIDPGEACSITEQSSPFEPQNFLRELKTDAFTKISLVSIARNYKRQFIGALCISACIVSMCVGFEGVLTIGHPIDAVFGGRYRYDLMVRGISPGEASRIADTVSGVEIAEPAASFSAKLLGETVRVSTADETSVLTVLTDASGSRIFPGDGIIVDEMRAKTNGLSVGDEVELDGHPLSVTGIAREILFPVMYISPETALNLFGSGPNCVCLKLDSDAEINEVEQQIARICDDAYFAEFASQKENITAAFAAMRTVMLCFAILAFCIGSLLVLNITIIDFHENRLRYAMLRALGTPVRRLGKIAVIQNLFRVGLGILVALPLSYACVSVLLGLLSGASQQYVMVKFTGCLILSCLFPLLYVLLGTGISLVRIKKMDFCSLINEVE